MNLEEMVPEDLEVLVVAVGKLSHQARQLWLLGLTGHLDEQHAVPNNLELFIKYTQISQDAT